MSQHRWSKQRIARDGHALGPEKIVKPSAYRPEGKSKGLHAILEPAAPWRHGQPVALSGPLGDVSVLLLWFRLDEAPIEGTAFWDRSSTIVAPALAVALRGLSIGDHLVVTGRDGRDMHRVHTDLPRSRLESFLSTAFDRGFHAYAGQEAKVERAGAAESLRSFVRGRAGDLKRWNVVADECYDAGAMEIWSRSLTPDELAARIDLDAINLELARADLQLLS